MTKDEAKEVTSYLLTKHSVLNSLTLIALNDLKEHTKNNDKHIYQGLRQNLNKLKTEQQEMHEVYKRVFPEGLTFWAILDVLNDLIDKELLK